MTKKVSFGMNTPQPSAETEAKMDKWVESRQNTNDAESAEEMTRLTFDIPRRLHARIKSQCALNGKKMNQVLRELLEKEFPG